MSPIIIITQSTTNTTAQPTNEKKEREKTAKPDPPKPPTSLAIAYRNNFVARTNLRKPPPHCPLSTNDSVILINIYGRSEPELKLSLIGRLEE